MSWKDLLNVSIIDADKLGVLSEINKEEIRKVVKKYPMCINPYYFSLIKEKNDPIWKQCIPDTNELEDGQGLSDPLCEEKDSPVPGLTHRYPDRVLLLVSNRCAMYCRFCTRKRRVGDPFKTVFKSQILQGIEYIKQHPEVRDVLLSGGDPLLLSDDRIEFILKELKKVKHVEIIRIGTRAPCTLPQRITPELCAMLKKYSPLYINVHFNHPSEITDASKKACEMLVDSGLPLSNQSVMLKGVNDDAAVMKELMYKLLQMRVRPYYIYQADLVKGTDHFRTNVKHSLNVIRGLNMFLADLPTPHFIIDSPGGGGKIPIVPDYDYAETNEVLHITNLSDLEQIKKNEKVKAVVIEKDFGHEGFVELLQEVRKANSDAIMVVNSNALVKAPDLVTSEACAELKKLHPLYINTFFSDIAEINNLHAAACTLLTHSGIPLGNKMHIEKGVEYNEQGVKKLMQKLLEINIRPYYVYFDVARNSVRKRTMAAVSVIRAIRGFTSGLAVPQIMVVNGGRKIIGPNYIVCNDENSTILQNYAGKIFEYPEPMDACMVKYRAEAETKKKVESHN